MEAVASSRRWSAIAVAVMVLGALFTVPSAVAQSGQGADKATRRAPMERFLAISTNPNENAKPVLLGFGPIHAKGVDKILSNHKDVYRFPNGSLIIRNQKVAGHRHNDPATCLFTFFQRGTYQVVRGTGDYAGAHGHGHYRVHAKFVGCNLDNPPDAFLLVIRAHGPLRL